MNFTSYSQIEQAYNQLQFDLALSENTSLFSEMHNYISENIVELPYSEDVFTEAKDGKNFLERIWDMIVGIWNAIKKFVVMIFRAVRQLFTGKSENDKLIEKLENNSEEIADNIQNKPAAEVVKVLTELFVPEKKEEVKKESVYLSEEKSYTNNYINKIKSTIDILYKKMPQNISFADFIKDKQNEKIILSIINQIGKQYGIEEKTSISSSLVKMIEGRLKANGLIMDVLDFIFSEDMEKHWDGYFMDLAFKGKRTGFSPKNTSKTDINFFDIIEHHKDLEKLIIKDLEIKKKFKYLTFDWVQKTSMKDSYIWGILYRSDLNKAFESRLQMQYAYKNIISIIYVIENCEKIISYNRDESNITPDDFNYYFSINRQTDLISWIYDRIHTNSLKITPLDLSKVSEFADRKKIKLTELNINISKYKSIIFDKIKPVSNFSNILNNRYKTDIDFFEDNGPSKFTSSKMYPLPDDLINAKGSMRYVVSNTLNYNIKQYNDALRNLNNFKNKISLFSLKRQALNNLKEIAFLVNGQKHKFKD